MRLRMANRCAPRFRLSGICHGLCFAVVMIAAGVLGSIDVLAQTATPKKERLEQSAKPRKTAKSDASSAKNKSKKKTKRKSAPFRWVNRWPAERFPHVKHRTFVSPSMKCEVGYGLYLPPQYDDEQFAEQRFPVVYYLHGGRPGSEAKSVKLAEHFHQAMSQGDVDPMIYVFVNGGPVSHYNLPDREEARGEDIFIRELIPHIDATYRTVADRKGRGLEGFSQGGRGTARIMFKHPGLFCSAAPGGGGYATEKRISENHGYENPKLKFAVGNNTWDLARTYAQHRKPPLRILVHVGDKGFNYENNLAYMKYLQELKIPFERLIVPGAPHSAMIIYDKAGLKLMRFHARNFAAARQSRK